MVEGRRAVFGGLSVGQLERGLADAFAGGLLVDGVDVGVGTSRN